MHRIRDDALLCDRSDKTRIELNNYRAVELELFKSFEAFRNKTESQNPFSRTFLCQIHALVINDLYPCGGQIREDATDLVEINASFTPASPAGVRLQLPDLLSECEKYVNNCQETLGDVTKTAERCFFAARIFHEFMKIHPFRGGNGRVGRALLDVLLARMGLIVPPMTLMSYCGRYRDRYFSCLRQADEGAIIPLRDYVFRGVWEARFDFIMDQIHERQNDPIVGPKIRAILRSHRDVLNQKHRTGLDDTRFFQLSDKTLKSLERAFSKALSELGGSR